jgi:hypothetical protein
MPVLYYAGTSAVTSTNSFGPTLSRVTERTQDETWVYRMLWNLGGQGMAGEDGRGSARWVGA